MISVGSYFSDNEKKFITILNKYFDKLSNKFGIVNGTVINRGNFVRYEIYFGEKKNDDLLILQFCVKDDEEVEEGFCKFVHISNIMIPYCVRRKGIATGIITLMSGIANYELGIYFYITGIVNDEWKNNLISHGGIEDKDGDIEICFDRWIDKIDCSGAEVEDISNR